MDLSKKRKTGDNCGEFTTAVRDDVVAPPPSLSTLSITPQDGRKILEPLSKDQLVDVLQPVVVRDVAVLDAVRSIADPDPTLRKLFIRSVGWETTTDKLRSVFSSFGELEDAVVVTDKATGKSKGYGFVTFKHIDGAVLALKEPNKKIDGRITVAQLAAVRDSGGTDVSMRKVYVGNVPFEISPETLLNYFSRYGEIEEGPLGFDKLSGKPKGFAFFIYKTEEGAKNSLVDPMKNIDGHQVLCKLASDGKKGKVGGPQGPTGMPGDAVTMPEPMPGSMNTGYGMPGGYEFSGGPPLRSHQNPQLSSSMPFSIGGGSGYGNQGPPSLGGGSGSGGGHHTVGYGNQGPPSFGGGSGGGGRHHAVGYGGGGFGPNEHYGGRAASGEYHGLNNYGSSMNRLPPRLGGHPDAGNYGLSSASQAQLPQAGPRGPLGGRFQGGPPFY